MPHYLVSARPKEERLGDLRRRLEAGEFVGLRPFGRTLTASLSAARRRRDGRAAWEEEDYCTPPLAQEREAVLDDYFDDLEVERVEAGEGWDRIEELPALFPDPGPDAPGG